MELIDLTSLHSWLIIISLAAFAYLGWQKTINGIYLITLFLPIYLISFLIVIIIVIGFWFYPPIIANEPAVPSNPARGLLQFVRKHNFHLLLDRRTRIVITYGQTGNKGGHPKKHYEWQD